MRKVQIVMMLLAFSMIAFSQDDVTRRYYKDKYRKKETTEKKGKYLEIQRKLNDSITQEEFINLKNNITLSKVSLLRNHQYGIGQFFKDDGQLDYEVDYNLVLKYGKYVPDGFLEIDFKSKSLLNNNDGKFEMPIINDSSNDVQLFVNRNLRYPQYAAMNGIQGTVFVQFSIDKDGKVGNISIVRGVHESIDLEACRTVNSIKVLKSAQLDEKSIDIVMTVPVTFRLQ